MKNSIKTTIVKLIYSILIITAASIATIFGLQSCNVSRTITSQSQYLQRGDTNIVIQTKTIETYDASKKL